MSVVHRLDVGYEWRRHGVKTIPRNVFEPFMGLDVFSIIGIDIPTRTILVTTNGMIFGFVAFGAEPIFLILDYASNEILASLANQGFVREHKGLLVLEDVHLGLLPAALFGQGGMTIETL